jgi:hypothetical protein
VLELQQRYGDLAHFRVVRYEDLIADSKAVMADLCGVTGLDPTRYRGDEASSLPIRGSSMIRSDNGEKIHWQPVEATDEFRPLERWQSWDAHVHRRFNELAGPAQRALGYDIEEVDGRDSLLERAGDVRDVLDVRLRELRVRLGRSRRAVRRVSGRI